MPGYNYGPPPPPPQAASSGQSGSGYGHGHGHHGGHYQQHNTPRGGGHASSRGGRGGYSAPARAAADYQSSPPQYEYAGHAPQPYGGAASYPAQPAVAAGYHASHQAWGQEHGHGHHSSQHHQPQPQPHAPAPLQTNNYHPNYAPTSYAQAQAQTVAAPQPGYGAPPPPPQQQQQQYPYHPPAPYNSQQQQQQPQPQPQPPHWGGHDRSQPQYAAGQHRGAYGSERGGSSRTPSMGVLPRADYGAQNAPPQVSGNYGQPYHDARAAPYPPQQPPAYHYAPPPAAPPSHPPHASSREYYSSNKHDGHYSGRGRGGFRGGNNPRGRNSHHGHGGDKARSRQHGNNNGPQNQKQDNNANNANNANQNSQGKKKKRKTNTLGLTPGQESESEDDNGEEESLCKLIGSDALQITDIASYLADRKKNFPTASRAKAKKSAEVVHGDKRAAAIEKEEKMAMKLRKQLEKVESSIKRKREQQDEGDEMRDNSPQSEAKSDDDDDEPEVLSTRSQGQQSSALSARKADVTKHCKYYSTGGTCGKKGKCRFVHDPQVREAAMKEREANNGQLTIQQRLILNDKDQEDLTVLQSIQYLREKGVISAADASSADGDTTSSTSNTRPQQPQPQSQQQPQPQTSSLPAAHASLPKPPVRRDHGLPPHTPPPSALQVAKSGGGNTQYKGWNLNGYGNNGLKSEDLP